MSIEDLNGKKVLLVGYGIDGKATQVYLQRHTSAKITVVDQNDGPDYLKNQQDFDIAIRSPGVSKKAFTIPVTTSANLFFSAVKGTTIGITGTKGKSTTASLAAHVLGAAGKKAHLAGNIGVPLLKALEETNEPDDIWVIELSSYMLDDIHYSPDYAIVINLFPEHINYHGTVDLYFGAKKNIIAHMNSNGTFIYNDAFAELEKWAKYSPAKTIPYQPDDTFLIKKNTTTMLPGSHNIANIQAVYALCHELAIPDSVFADAVADFQPLVHRLQTFATYQGITFVDDAISTTPESTIAAIHAVAPVGSILLGGLDRGYDFTALAQEIEKENIQTLVFFPDSGSKILGMLKERQFTPAHMLETRSMEEAVRFLFEHTPEGSTCLLSTASPSYSIWKNFEEKGDQFQKWVHTYGRTTDKKETSDRQENSKQDQDKTEVV